MEKEMILRAAAQGNLRDLKKFAREQDKGEGIRATIAAAHDSEGEGALHWAARFGRKEICRYLIENLQFSPDLLPSGVPKERRSAGNIKLYSEKTPLICAVYEGSINTIQYLLDIGANPNARDENKFTALHTAVQQGQVESLRALASKGLEKGIEIDALHYVGTPLLFATARDDDLMVNILLDHKADAGADVNEPVAVLEMAIGSKELLNCLLESGANPNIPDADKIRSNVKVARLTQMIDELMDKQGFLAARYLCFYALQEDPTNVEINAKKALCRMKMDRDMFDGLFEVHLTNSPQVFRRIAQMLYSMGVI
ncbi:hypothetical protein LUZ60_005329 [Juncus effusus]|nr:hypothetical protein LUZ60_005329 [Juncus effusus]